MIARILEDRRYIGERDFPAIIQPETFRRAEEKRSFKQRPAQRTPAQRVLSSLCKSKVTAGVEAQVLALLNRLIDNPERLQPPIAYNNNCPQTAKTQQQLDTVIAQQPVDEDEANRLILRLAAERYECLGSNEYETERLKRLFTNMTLMSALDAETLCTSVSSVQINRGKVSLTLKNGQIIEMR